MCNNYPDTNYWPDLNPEPCG